MNFSITDETFTGQVLKRMSLAIDHKVITIRDLICMRVKQEIEEKVQKYKELQLIDCTESSPMLDSQSYLRIEKEKAARVKDECKRAVEAFTQNAFFIFIGNEQVQDLSYKIRLDQVSKASFIKLLPLVGG